MKRLRLKTEQEFDPYYGDVTRIIHVCQERGFHIDYETAKTAWEKYSESMCAGWMRLDADVYVFANIEPYLVEEN